MAIMVSLIQGTHSSSVTIGQEGQSFGQRPSTTRGRTQRRARRQAALAQRGTRSRTQTRA